MKPTPKIYKGIEYILLSDVPESERALLQNSFRKHHYIKILIDKKIVDGCILFKDYLNWLAENNLGESSVPRPLVEPGIKLPVIK